MGTPHRGSPVWRFHNTVAPCMAFVFWGKPIWGRNMCWLMGSNTYHNACSSTPSWISYFWHWKLIKMCSEAIIPFWKVFLVDSPWVPVGSRGFPYNGFPVWRFQNTIGRMYGVILILSWAKPIWSSIICWIMGSKQSGFPACSFQNTVGTMYGVMFDFVLGQTKLR